MKQSLDLAALHSAGEMNAIGNSQLSCQLSQFVELRSLANDCRLCIDVAHGADEHIESLIIDKASDRHNVPGQAPLHFFDACDVVSVQRSPVAEIDAIWKD